MIKPFNDHLLVELETSQWVAANTNNDGEQDPSAGTGIVIDIPDTFGWLSSYTWIAEASVFDNQAIRHMRDMMKDLKGKRVYFEQRAEIGNVIEQDGKKYAVIKLSKITGVEDDKRKD